MNSSDEIKNNIGHSHTDKYLCNIAAILDRHTIK